MEEISERTIAFNRDRIPDLIQFKYEFMKATRFGFTGEPIIYFTGIYKGKPDSPYPGMPGFTEIFT
jgi:hypothetical protein